MYLLLSTGKGQVKVFFDPRCSSKGALLTSARAPRREPDPADAALVVGEIINPHALPMYRVSRPLPDHCCCAMVHSFLRNPVVTKKYTYLLGSFQNDSHLPHHKRKNMHDPTKAKVPEQKVDSGPGRRPNNSFFFTQFVTNGLKKDNSRSEDPREALLKLDSLTKSDPIYLGRTYSTTQPVTQMTEMTFEEEQEEFRKKQKRLP